MRYIKHIMRGKKYRNLCLIIEKKIQEKRFVKRRYNFWMKTLLGWFLIKEVLELQCCKQFCPLNNIAFA